MYQTTHGLLTYPYSEGLLLDVRNSLFSQPAEIVLLLSEGSGRNGGCTLHSLQTLGTGNDGRDISSFTFVDPRFRRCEAPS